MKRFSLALGLAALVSAKENGLARTPPMGWSSWNQFGGHQSAALLTTTADALVSTGLAALGYTQCVLRALLLALLLRADPPPRRRRRHGRRLELVQVAQQDRLPDGGAHSGAGRPRVGGGAAREGLQAGHVRDGGFESVYEHEEKWAAKMFGKSEWNADRVKVDHKVRLLQLLLLLRRAPSRTRRAPGPPSARRPRTDGEPPATSTRSSEM